MKSDTRPILSPLPNGAYGTPSSWAGPPTGPQPSSLAATEGTLNDAMLGNTRWLPNPVFALRICVQAAEME